MGFPTKIQLIKRAKSEQWYINFPSAIAQAMEFDRGEVVEWLIQNKHTMILKRDESVLGSKKTSDGSLIDELDLLINQCTGAFSQDSAWKTGRELAFGALTCMGRHTLTGMLTASGQQEKNIRSMSK